MTQLTGKICLVTAAAQGIGRASAERMVQAGARVIATDDINAAALAEVQGAETHLLDVTDPKAILAFAKQVGTVDVLFNCAGFVHNGIILECTEDEWDYGVHAQRQVNVQNDSRLYHRSNACH